MAGEKKMTKEEKRRGLWLLLTCLLGSCVMGVAIGIVVATSNHKPTPGPTPPPSDVIKITTATELTYDQKYYDDRGFPNTEQTIPVCINLETLAGDSGKRVFEVEEEINCTIFIPSDFSCSLSCEEDKGSIDVSMDEGFPAAIFCANDKINHQLTDAVDMYIFNNNINFDGEEGGAETYGIWFYGLFTTDSNIIVENNYIACLNSSSSIPVWFLNEFEDDIEVLVRENEIYLDSTEEGGKAIDFLGSEKGDGINIQIIDNEINMIGGPCSGVVLEGNYKNGSILVEENTIYIDESEKMMSGDFVLFSEGLVNEEINIENNYFSVEGGEEYSGVRMESVQGGDINISSNYYSMSGMDLEYGSYHGIKIDEMVNNVTLTISKNTILEENVWIGYGIRVAGDVDATNDIYDNAIFVEGNWYSCGIEIGGGSTGGIKIGTAHIHHNTIKVSGNGDIDGILMLNLLQGGGYIENNIIDADGGTEYESMHGGTAITVVAITDCSFEIEKNIITSDYRGIYIDLLLEATNIHIGDNYISVKNEDVICWGIRINCYNDSYERSIVLEDNIISIEATGVANGIEISNPQNFVSCDSEHKNFFYYYTGANEEHSVVTGGTGSVSADYLIENGSGGAGEATVRFATELHEVIDETSGKSFYITIMYMWELANEEPTNQDIVLLSKLTGFSEDEQWTNTISLEVIQAFINEL